MTLTRLTKTPVGFPLPDEQDAPEDCRAFLDQQLRAQGFVPLYASLLANSPAVLAGYEELSRSFASSKLTRTEKQLIMLAASYVNNCGYCMAAHSYSARRQHVDDRIVDALRQGEPVPDPRLEALRVFTVELTERRGEVSAGTLARFLEAGYTHEQALEVVLAVTIKTLTSLADKLAQLPLDEAYRAEAWTRPAPLSTD